MKMKKKIDLGKLAVFYSNYGVFFVLLIVFIGASLYTQNFLTANNILSVLNQNALTAILGCGMTMLLISGYMDLSAGQCMIMANVACAVVLTATNSIFLAILAAIGVAVVGEMFNGFAISYLQLNFFVATLSSQFIFKGVGYLLCDGTPVYGTPGITVLAQSKLFGVIPILIIFMVVFAGIAHFILNKTSFGRYLYAIGGNKDASRASGINVKKTTFINFICMGIFVGITAVLYTARANSGQPNGTDLTFDTIIAAVLGGTGVVGGAGSIIGTVAGAMVGGIINNVMNLAGVSPFYQNIVKGIIIFVAILIDKVTRDTIMKAK